MFEAMEVFVVVVYVVLDHAQFDNQLFLTLSQIINQSLERTVLDIQIFN